MNIFGKLRAKHRTSGVFCALASITLCGCAPKSPQPDPEPDTAQAQAQASADVLSGDRYIGSAALEKPGLYALRGDALRVSERGKPQWLAATNADRGFGFGKPVGASFPDAVTAWYASDLPLRPHQIRMTRYRGVAAPAASAHADVDDANTAWIAEKNIPVSVNCRERRCRIGVSRPLEPGVYVIHDDSLFRAARQDEVTAYYPFIIEKDGKNPWLSQAESCFDIIYNKNEARTGGDAAKEDAPGSGELAACADALRLAWKIAPDKRGDYVLKLLYMGSMMNPDDRAIRRELDARCDGKSQGLARDIWRRSQLNLIRDYADLSAKYHASEVVLPEAAKAIVGACDAEYADAAAIDMLLWRPFYALDARDERLAGLFDAVVRGEAWQTQLADLLGALAYRGAAERAKTDRALSAGLKRIQSQIPESFKVDATLMTLRAGARGIAFGPIAFAGAPEDAQTIWRATLQGYFGAIASCAQTHDAPKKSMFIIEIPLNGSPLDAASHIVVRDPLAQLRQTPAISPTLVSCMVSALSGIAVEPALETTQRAYVAVTFGE